MNADIITARHDGRRSAPAPFHPPLAVPRNGPSPSPAALAMPCNLSDDDMASLSDLERDEEVISISDSESEDDSSYAFDGDSDDDDDGFDDGDDKILMDTLRARSDAEKQQRPILPTICKCAFNKTREGS